jgi:hypothetical protein
MFKRIKFTLEHLWFGSLSFTELPIDIQKEILRLYFLGEFRHDKNRKVIPKDWKVIVPYLIYNFSLKGSRVCKQWKRYLLDIRIEYLFSNAQKKIESTGKITLCLINKCELSFSEIFFNIYQTAPTYLQLRLPWEMFFKRPEVSLTRRQITASEFNELFDLIKKKLQNGSLHICSFNLEQRQCDAWLMERTKF